MNTASPLAAARTEPTAGEGPILVVDDDADLRGLLLDVLRSKGFAVTGAPDGREALRILRTSGVAFGLVVLDLMMPVINGWQFRREQQEDPALASIPVLVLSAGVNVGEVAASIGAVGYLKKPIDIAALLGAIQRLMRLEA
jgi:CheY-like chemotaxis protein